MTSDTAAIPADVHQRLFELRCKSKRGDMPHPSKEEMDFMMECLRKWPKEYEAMSRDVFVETAPFGSQL